MEHLRFHPLNPRQEAAAVLSRLAYREDNERSGDMRVSIDYYCKKYNVYSIICAFVHMFMILA